MDLSQIKAGDTVRFALASGAEIRGTVRKADCHFGDVHVDDAQGTWHVETWNILEHWPATLEDD